MFNVKLSLVTSTGLLLASKPESVDETKQILATGLMTALISFSKEVHQRELQSISYHDRTVSFLRVDEFVIIIETIGEETPISEEELDKLLHTIKDSSIPMLDGMDANTMSEGEAELILEKCFQDLYKMEYSMAEQPMQTGVISYFNLFHSDKGWEIKGKMGTGAHIPMIAYMLDTHEAHKKFKGEMRTVITSIPEEKCTTLSVIDTEESKSRVGILKFPLESDFTLFRLYPDLERMIEILSKRKEKYEMDEILNTLREVDDPGNRLSRINIDDLSPTFLDRTIRRNLDKAIYSSIVGETILVIGDKPTVRLVIDTLSIFTQHFQTTVNVWITEEDFENGKCNVRSKICGMSPEIYNKLVDVGWVEETMTIIDLEASRVKGNKSSNHFNKLFDTIKRLKTSEVTLKILNELEKIVSAAIHITSFGLVDKEQGIQKLKEFGSQSNLPTSVFKKAIQLAVRINPLLDYLL
jgi:hypothetical protein